MKIFEVRARLTFSNISTADGLRVASCTHDRFGLAPRRRAGVVQWRTKEKGDPRTAGGDGPQLVTVGEEDGYEGLSDAGHRCEVRCGVPIRVPISACTAGEHGFAGFGEDEVLPRREGIHYEIG